MRRTYTIEDVIYLYKSYPDYFSTKRKYNKDNERESSFHTKFHDVLQSICINEIISKLKVPAHLYHYTNEEISNIFNAKIAAYQNAVKLSNQDNDYLPLRQFFAAHKRLEKVIIESVDVLIELATAYQATLEEYAAANCIFLENYFQLKESKFKSVLLQSGVKEESTIQATLLQIKTSLQAINKQVEPSAYLNDLQFVANNWLMKVNLIEVTQQETREYLQSFGIRSTHIEEALKLINCDEIIRRLADLDVTSLGYQNEVKELIKNKVREQALFNIDKLNQMKESPSLLTRGQFQPTIDPVEKLIKKKVKTLPQQLCVIKFVKDRAPLNNILSYFAEWDKGGHDFRNEFDKCIKKIIDACIANDDRKLIAPILVYLESSEAHNFFYDPETHDVIQQLVNKLMVSEKNQSFKSSVNKN